MIAEKPQCKASISHIPSQMWICLILVTAVIVVYSQVVNHGFVNFDDFEYVADNPNLYHGLTIDAVKSAFKFSKIAYWHPLTWLSHLLDVELYGMHSGRHLQTNALFHILNTLLLFLALKKMTGTLWRSAVVAAFFALHPLNVESVAWLAERKNVLSTFFWMLSLFAYVHYAQKQNFARYFMVLIVFTLGLTAKPMLVTLPFVFFLLDYWPLGRFRALPSGSDSIERVESVPAADSQSSILLHLVIEKLPLFAISAISIRLSTLSYHANPISFDAVPLKLRIANAMVSYIDYIGKMIWPHKLAVYYPYPYSLPPWKVIGAALILTGISVLVIRQHQRKPYLITGWLWYLGTLVPVLGLIQVGLWPAMADRWVYVPLIGIFIMIVWEAPALLAKLRFKAVSVAAVTSMLLVILMTISRQQVKYWANGATLFQHALEVTGDNVVANNNLGNALMAQDRIAQAVHHYSLALQDNSGHAPAHNNLGVAFFKQGRVDMAIRHYSTALDINPDYAEAHNNLGIALKEQDRLDEAVRHYSEALRLKPKYAAAHLNLGLALMRKGKVKVAVIYFRKALQIKPYYSAARNSLAKALAAQSTINAKKTRIQRDLEHNPDDHTLHYELGAIYKRESKWDQAIVQYTMALAGQPRFAPALKDLALVYALQGEYEKAISSFEKLIEFWPDNFQACYYIACIYAKQNKGAESVVWLQKAIAKGYDDWDRIRIDGNLKNIRNTSYFQKITKDR